RDQHMAKIGTIEITLGTKALARGKFRLKKLAVIDSNIHLERDAQGNANWSFGSATLRGEENPVPSLGSLYLENSTLTYLDVPQETVISMKATTEGDHFVLTGDGKHLGKPFALIGNFAATCLAHHARSCPLETTLTVGHTSLHAKGTLTELVPPQRADFMV